VTVAKSKLPPVWKPPPVPKPQVDEGPTDRPRAAAPLECSDHACSNLNYQVAVNPRQAFLGRFKILFTLLTLMP
jgi:hypothetical protein